MSFAENDEKNPYNKGKGVQLKMRKRKRNAKDEKGPQFKKPK